MPEPARPRPLDTLRWRGGAPVQWAPGKLVCAGRNYAAHARELNNPVPETPLLFMKPRTALVDMAAPIALPRGLGACHHEIELALLIGAEVADATLPEAAAAIVGVALALDLTLRDLQGTLKRDGHPWERAKAFDGSCPISEVLPIAQAGDPAALEITLAVNGAVRQRGQAAMMLTPPAALVREIGRAFRLMPGDLVLTGTPAGVEDLMAGDTLRAELVGHFAVETRVQA